MAGDEGISMEARCYFCYVQLEREHPDTYHKVTSWVHGPKLDSPKLRTRTGEVAHKKCVENLIAGQASNQPELEL